MSLTKPNIHSNYEHSKESKILALAKNIDSSPVLFLFSKSS